MNRERRREIARAQKLCADALDIITEVRDLEDTAKDCVRGSSDRAREMEENVWRLDVMIDDLGVIVGESFGID